MASQNCSRIAINFLPSLQHFSSVKTAVAFFSDLDLEILDAASTQLEQNDPTASQNSTEQNLEVSRAKRRLLVVPAHLRKTVVRAFHGFHHSVEDWRDDHKDIFEFDDERIRFYCRSEGTIDAVRTAENLVQNKKLSERERFKVACMYFFEQRILTLWEKITASGRAGRFDNEENFVVRFWVRWLREGHSVPWLQAARSYLDLSPYGSFFRTRYSAFLPLLGLEDRRKYLKFFRYASSDDLRFSLYALTEAEQEVVKTPIVYLLLLYLSWPLQTLFEKEAEKLWHRIDYRSFRVALSYALGVGAKFKDFDYSLIFEFFWKRIPDDWKETGIECSFSTPRLDLLFDEAMRKRRSVNK